MGTRAYDDVIFDCDSTLSTLEGIDELAVRAGCGAQIAALTDAAMNGTLPLESVYGERLRLIRPSLADVLAIGARYIATAVDGARDVVAALHGLGCRVFVVSGGIEQAVVPFAAWLGVPADRVHAVRLSFDADGAYIGVMPSPLTTSQGKSSVILALRDAGRRAMLVGDGASDMVAAHAVDTFIGFGGVVARAKVEAGADHFIRERSLWPVLALVKG